MLLTWHKQKILFEYLYKRTYVSMYVSNTLQTNMLVSKCMQLRTYFYHFSCISSVLRMYLCERFLCFISVLSTFFFQNEWLTDWMNEWKNKEYFLIIFELFCFYFLFFCIYHTCLIVCLLVCFCVFALYCGLMPSADARVYFNKILNPKGIQSSYV